MRFRFFFASIFNLSLSLCFTGCTPLVKKSITPNVMEAGSLSSSIEKAITTSTFCRGDWPSDQWWTLFGDPQLNEIIEIAIRDSPDLMAAASRLKASIEVAKKEKSSFFPKLEGSFQVLDRHLSRNELPHLLPSILPRSFDQIQLDLNFDYEIDFFGKNRQAYLAALGLTKVEMAEMSQSHLIVTTSLAQSYIHYATSLQKLALINKVVRDRKAFCQLVQKREQGGVEEPLAFNLAKSLLLEEEKRVLECTEEVEMHRNQIKILMGAPLDDPRKMTPPDLFFDRPFPLPETLPLNLLARRPDLMARILKVEASASRVNRAKSAFFPNVNLKALAGLHSLHWKDLFSFKSLSSLVYPAIHLPLFTGGKLTATLNEEVAKYEASVWEYHASVLKAAKEVIDQMHTLETVTQQAEMTEKVSLCAQRSLEVTLARYEKGVDSYLLVLHQEIDVKNRMIEEVEAEGRRFLSILLLIKALGGGYEG